jgi:L-alanine-DL-glutamate epimerase-like enolase superfamily enzyme
MSIEAVQVDHYRVPLPVVLSDATHGRISHFELVTARLRARDGAEGLGYTYTVGADPERVEALWERMWWRLHYVGRGGLAAFAVSAVEKPCGSGTDPRASP